MMFLTAFSRQVLFALVAGFLMFMAAQPANAGTVAIGNPVVPAGVSFTGVGLQGQSFIAPPGATRLLGVGVVVWGAQATDISVKQGVGPGFPPLSPSTSFGAGAGAAVFREMVLPAGGIAVTAGQQYFIESSNGVIALAADYYADGAMQSHPTRDAYFIAVFEVPEPVPTVSEWVMIAMGVAFAGTAVLMLSSRRRRQRLAQP